MSKTEITAPTGAPTIVITREFDAPRELVYRAFTDPALLERWLGPRELAMSVDRYEVRDGGRWRYVHTDGDGNSYGFHGIFHGTPSPDAIVQTFEFEGAPGHVKLDTTTLEPRGGATYVRTISVFQTVEDRDAMVAMDMERGVRDSDERLEELLSTLRGAA
jgi:uncharacterized protein YndB with AHSA1/START domain